MAGLYVHIPFQRAPHTYDDSDAVDPASVDLSTFVSALRRELRSKAHTYTARSPISTLYIGGGCSSLLSLGALHSILQTVRDTFDASDVKEATIEIHPADATPSYLHGLRRMGVDRLSLPVLSFFPSALQAVNASHTADDAIQAVRQARTAGFDTLSIDLLFGWPNHSLSDWQAVLRMVVAMGLPHVTLLEADERLGPVAPDETLADQFECAMRLLQSEGYDQNELTHFAQQGHYSLHQRQYYAHENQLGVGPSAESFWWPRRHRDGTAQRWTNVADLSEYETLISDGASPVSVCETLDRIALAREYVMLRFRTRSGLDLHHLHNRYGVDLQRENEDMLNRLRDEDLLDQHDATLRLTNKGVLVAEAIAQRLLPSD